MTKNKSDSRETQGDQSPLFTEADVVYAYTDEAALRDGHLINIAPLRIYFQGMFINRVTAGVWSEFLRTGYARADDPERMDMEAFKRALQTKLEHAQLKGGIWHLPPGLWLIENEVCGWALMSPEDY